MGHFENCCSGGQCPKGRDQRAETRPRPSRYPPRDGRVHTIYDEYDFLPEQFDARLSFSEDYVV